MFHGGRWRWVARGVTLVGVREPTSVRPTLSTNRLRDDTDRAAIRVHVESSVPRLTSGARGLSVGNAGRSRPSESRTLARRSSPHAVGPYATPRSGANMAVDCRSRRRAGTEKDDSLRSHRIAGHGVPGGHCVSQELSPAGGRAGSGRVELDQTGSVHLTGSNRASLPSCGTRLGVRALTRVRGCDGCRLDE